MGYTNTVLKQTNLYDRVKKLLVSDEWSDCCFSVSGKDFKAHKLILGISSPVFEAMFFGPLSTNTDIMITDIEPDIFQLLLNYIYTDKVEISCVEEAFQLLYASRKYILDSLSIMCVAYIQANISVDNVIEILNYPEYLHDEQLTSFALKLFCEHASYLFEESRDLITPFTMKAILETDNINISEFDLIKHVLEWTTQYCKQNSVPETYENRREVLLNYGLFKMLRFSTLSLDEFNKIKEQMQNILLPSEVQKITLAINSTPTESNFFKPRNPLKFQLKLCNRNHLKSVAPINIGFNNFVIHSRVRANKSIFITSLCIPTRMAPVTHFHSNVPKNYSEQLSVSIVSESDNATIKLTNFMNTVEYNFYVDIELSEPCYIKKNNWYQISFTWPENRFQTYSYVVEVRERVVKNDNKLTFEFDDISTGMSGSFLEGFKYCF